MLELATLLPTSAQAELCLTNSAQPVISSFMFGVFHSDPRLDQISPSIETPAMPQSSQANGIKAPRPIPSIELPADLIDKYKNIKTIQSRFVFYENYFSHLSLSKTLEENSLLACFAHPDLSVSGKRKILDLMTLYSGRIIMQGLVASQSDKKVDVVAGDEAYTRVLEHEHEELPHFRFFEARDKVTFFKGDMGTGDWKREGTWHPIREVNKVLAYLQEYLKEDGLWEEESALASLVSGVRSRIEDGDEGRRL